LNKLLQSRSRTMRKSVSACRAAKTAKAEAKRAARAQAKADKEAKSKAMAVAAAEEVDGLIADLKTLLDNACERLATDMRAAAELAFRLEDEYGLTQFKIGARIGRSQQWVSAVLIWRSNGYPDTAFGPQARQARAKLLPVTGKTEPDPQVGMPPGPKLTLLPDNTTITVADRSAGNAGDPVAEGKVMEAKLEALATPPTSTSEPSDPAEAPAPTALSREEISADALTAAKQFWREQIADKISEDDWRKYRLLISDEKQCMPGGWRTRKAA
jgi:hypothetical protein